MVEGTSRFPVYETITTYLAAGQRVAIPVRGAPDARLVIDAPANRIGVEVAWDGEAVPTVEGYANLRTEILVRDGDSWAALWITDGRYFAAAYPLLCAVADQVQLHDHSFARAVPNILESFAGLLASLGRMSIDDEVGLLGELYVLEHLVRLMGTGEAVASWRGPDNEEHDFALENFDVEVKTTTAESRRHWITSLTQLVPKQGRPLYVVSIQLTGASATAGWTLSEVITKFEQRLGPIDRDAFAQRLHAAGWRGAEGTSGRRFLLRSRIESYEVSPAFPAIVPDRLHAGGVDVSCITAVAYQMDFGGLSPAILLPPPLQGIDVRD